LNTGVLLTSLLPVLGFCIICIIGTLHTIISRKTSQGHHHGSERWRTALMDWNEPLASDGHDSMSPEYRVSYILKFWVVFVYRFFPRFLKKLTACRSLQRIRKLPLLMKWMKHIAE